MIKRLKRTFYLILGLLALGATWLYANSNSHKFATDVAYLECTLQEVSSDQRDKDFLDAVKKDAPIKIFARLRKDWIGGGAILLNWAADVGLSEDGLERTQTLIESINNYSGSLGKYDTQAFNRGTLLYTRVQNDALPVDQTKEACVSDILDPFKCMNVKEYEEAYRITRHCKIVDESIFGKERKKSAAATKAKQKI